MTALNTLVQTLVLRLLALALIAFTEQQDLKTITAANATLAK
jgi:hypothetical protein